MARRVRRSSKRTERGWAPRRECRHDAGHEVADVSTTKARADRSGVEVVGHEGHGDYDADDHRRDSRDVQSPECPGWGVEVRDRQGVASGAAYDELSDEEKQRFASLWVVHSLEASQRRVSADPSPEELARWRARPTHEHPLVWTHRSGGKSLVLGASADYVVGMDLDEGRALLAELLDRATAADKVYSHDWSVGDTVIWDNRGVLHRAAPYDPDSPREMLRTTVLGDEPIR